MLVGLLALESIRGLPLVGTPGAMQAWDVGCRQT
jgi:hypothetical protein